MHYTASEILSEMECRIKETNPPTFTADVDCVEHFDIAIS